MWEGWDKQRERREDGASSNTGAMGQATMQEGREGRGKQQRGRDNASNAGEKREGVGKQQRRREWERTKEGLGKQ